MNVWLVWLVITASILVSTAMIILSFIVWMMCRAAKGEFE